MHGSPYDGRAKTSLPVPLRLLLVRHGLSSFNRERRIQGRNDLSSLTAEGHQQASKTGEVLSNLTIDAVYSSPLKRAAATTDNILQTFNEGLKPIFDEGLLEIELGPWSGFLTFHIEKMGGDVISIELDHKKYKWDIVKRVKHNWQEELNVFVKREKKMRNSYWYAHKAFNSKSKLILSHINDLPAELEIYDISLMCAVLLHLQNPFLGIQNMLRHTKEKAIITELGGYTRIKSFRNTIRNLIRRIMRPPVHDFHSR